MTPSKSVKPHTPHPTPYTLPLGKTFSANPKYLSKINYTYLTTSCLLSLASCLLPLAYLH
ncbi:MAG: hypothetical protein O9295_14250 [Microcystis sp. LE18-22.4A]|uniref:hypothetical protein n=1 Tax=Microcystis sp. LE19-195.1E TaxID=3016440 RepID=UPI0022C5D325|nr:hypothetical protein [Microcystis sp. LE19-195.1E]MCZ8119179.1 hypothetical protein [Microcystis sp. LE18-22.4A]